jgi:hypothetical protein
MRRMLVVLVLAAAVAGCSGDGGQPTVGGVAPALPASAHGDPIPMVREPKDLAGTPPCALLTRAQLARNHIDLPGQTKDVLGAPGCQWGDKAHTREIRVFKDIGTDDLHNVYAQRATFAVFEVTEVTGYPAIRTKDNVDGTTCFLRVATAKTQTLNLTFTSLRQGLEEPCGPARELAETVLANLPPLKG